MGKIIGLLFCITILFSCKKDKVFLCEGVSMTGNRTEFVGKWRWHKTWVTQWFDLGPDILLIYTPQNQDFEYYFTISEGGEFNGYKNNILVHDFVLSEVQFENFSSTIIHGMRVSLNCTEEEINIARDFPLLGYDSLRLPEYPLNFNDQGNKLYSNTNFFMRE